MCLLKIPQRRASDLESKFVLVFVEAAKQSGTDISKITGKPSKIGKHGHEERKSTKKARDAKPKAGKVKKSKLWSTLGQFSVNKSQP
ncbi:hypothetical protein Tco_0871260 [Tanacetum coccineum]